MPRPVTRAAWHYLMDSGVPAQLLDRGLLGYDPEGEPFDHTAGGWVFAAEKEGDPYRWPEGTGRCAVALFSYDDWTTRANARQYSDYPRLHLSVLSDPSRDQNGNPTGHDAEDRADAVWKAIDPLFHDAANRIHAFASLRVLSTVQGGTPLFMPVPEHDGLVRLDITYNIHLA